MLAREGLDKQPAMPSEEVSGVLRPAVLRIGDVVKPWADRLPNHPALVEASGVWTYRQLAAAVAETEAWFQGLGVRPGDRVMLVCENCRVLVAMVLALTNLDCWPVLVNARLSGREIDEIRDHCGARRVIYTTGVSAQAREHARKDGAVTMEMTDGGPVGVGPLHREAEPEPIEAHPASRVAALLYTSGSTGAPKGVMLTHRNLLFVAAGSASIRSLQHNDRLYGVLPISHVVGLSAVVLATLLSGATLYLSPRFDPVAALAALERDQLTVMLGAPALFALFVEYTKHKGLRALRLPALRIISCSGAPLHLGLKSEVESLFGLTLHHGYGVTESSPNIAQTRVEAPRKDTSVGPVFPGVELKLVGANLEPVPDGEVGEIWVRGPNIMKGYYRAPEETAAAIDAAGWLNTRDLARIEDGNLFIVGRTTELIVRFGFNVYPAEVEAVLNACPGVVRSAVLGRTVEEDGNEEVVAFIQTEPGSSLTAMELARHAAQYLAPYKQPSQIVLLSSMPTSPTHKVIKSELKKLPAYAQPR